MTKPVVYVSFDVETTALSPATGQLLEIGAVAIRPNGDLVSQYYVALHQDELKGDQDILNFLEKSGVLKRWRSANKLQLETGMTKLLNYLSNLEQNYKVVRVAWPSSFDWGWILYHIDLYGLKLKRPHSCECASSLFFVLSKANKDTVEARAAEHLKRQRDQIPGDDHHPVYDAAKQGFKFACTKDLF